MKTVFWILTSILLFGLPALARAGFLTGFNQGWFHSHKGTSWECSWIDLSQSKKTRPLCFDEKSAIEMLDATRQFGGKILRMWLFEGVDNEALIWEGDTPRLQGSVLPNLRRFMELARERDVLIYWNLLAGVTQDSLKDQPAQVKNRWWNILNKHYGAREKFLKGVVAPLLPLFDEFHDQIYGLDIFNEIDSAILGYVFDVNDGAKGWAKANQFVCEVRGFVRGYSTKPIKATASLGWPWFPFRHDGAPRLIASQPYGGCLDFYDFHHYEREGGIPNCKGIKKLAESKPVILGEFGQTGRFDWIREPETPDQLDDSGLERALNVQIFLRHAKACGISAALAWRLKEVDANGRAVHNSYMGI